MGARGGQGRRKQARRPAIVKTIGDRYQILATMPCTHAVRTRWQSRSASILSALSRGRQATPTFTWILRSMLPHGGFQAPGKLDTRSSAVLSVRALPPPRNLAQWQGTGRAVAGNGPNGPRSDDATAQRSRCCAARAAGVAAAAAALAAASSHVCSSGSDGSRRSAARAG